MSSTPLPMFGAATGSRSAESALVDELVRGGALDAARIQALLSLSGRDHDALVAKGHSLRLETLGNRIYFRGIVEVSNLCRKDCHYCGIRRSNRTVERFCLTRDEVLGTVRWAHEQGYGSVVLQAGERTDSAFVTFIEELLRGIGELSGGSLGVTLSLGEQSAATYRRWFDAGAHRYLLRIETSDPELYRRIHPADHSYDARIACLRELRTIGYQVGTGVMIGLPGQSLHHLASDVVFFRELDVDMIGMGPYVLHEQTPLAADVDTSEDAKRQRFELALRMIAVCRLAMPTINIAATTALQALHPTGRELGLRAGANIIMPILTPTEYRRHYQLYEGKPCLDDNAGQCQKCLEARIESGGDVVGYGARGDSPHALQRLPGA